MRVERCRIRGRLRSGPLSIGRAGVIVCAIGVFLACGTWGTTVEGQTSPAVAVTTTSLDPPGPRAADSVRDSVGPNRTAVAPDSSVATRKTKDSDPITAAAREYERTGIARVVEEGAFVTFPYGHAQPTVTCAPLRACVIELEAGEAVLSKIAGDTQRWEIQLAPAGADARTPLIVVKPHDCGLTTNLVLATTTGRIYDLTLDSPPCPRSGVNPHGVYVRHVRFYYPDAMVQAWNAPASSTSRASARSSARTGAASEVDGFNFAYRVERDRKFPWAPVAVFDDGAHCYIKLPDRAAHRDAPVLFALGEDGTKTLLNYTLSGDTYVTDRVFRSAELVVGEGGRERALRLENLRYDASAGLDSNREGRPNVMGGVGGGGGGGGGGNR